MKEKREGQTTVAGGGREEGILVPYPQEEIDLKLYCFVSLSRACEALRRGH